MLFTYEMLKRTCSITPTCLDSRLHHVLSEEVSPTKQCLRGRSETFLYTEGNYGLL